MGQPDRPAVAGEPRRHGHRGRGRRARDALPDEPRRTTRTARPPLQLQRSSFLAEPGGGSRCAGTRATTARSRASGSCFRARATARRATASWPRCRPGSARSSGRSRASASRSRAAGVDPRRGRRRDRPGRLGRLLAGHPVRARRTAGDAHQLADRNPDRRHDDPGLLLGDRRRQQRGGLSVPRRRPARDPARRMDDRGWLSARRPAVRLHRQRPHRAQAVRVDERLRVDVHAGLRDPSRRARRRRRTDRGRHIAGHRGSFAPGAVVPISWSASDDEGVRGFTLQASYDEGRTWHQLAAELPASTRTFNWQTPTGSGLGPVRLRVVARDLRFQTSSATTTLTVGCGRGGDDRGADGHGHDPHGRVSPDAARPAHRGHEHAADARLVASVTATGQVIGTLTPTGDGRHTGAFSWGTDPRQVTVRSSAGATRTAMTIRR